MAYEKQASNPSLPKLCRLAAWFYTALTLAAVGWIYLRTGHWLPASIHEGRPVFSLAVGATVGLAAVVISDVLTHRYAPLRTLACELHRLLGPIDRPSAFLLAAFSSVGEELFFRAGMQPAFGYTLTSLLFGLVHVGPNRRFRAWTLSAVVMGFAFGGIVVMTGNILGAILAHFLINFINLQRIGAMEPAPKVHE